MEHWKGRVALVTGAGKGIGFATAKLLAQNGMRVVAADRNIEKIKILESELSQSQRSQSIFAVECDLTNDDQVNALFLNAKNTLGGVDVCINNAGMSFNSSLIEGTTAEWRATSDLNIVALCLCSKLSVASMRERNVDDGHIINLCSVLGHIFYPKKSRHFYTGTKWAIRAITEGLRQELREAGSHIRASVISPGIVDTEFGIEVARGEECVKNKYDIDVMKADEVAEGILTILAAPMHVEINDIIIRPTEEKM